MINNIKEYFFTLIKESIDNKEEIEIILKGNQRIELNFDSENTTEIFYDKILNSIRINIAKSNMELLELVFDFSEVIGVLNRKKTKSKPKIFKYGLISIE